jgi:hypothetical protein
MGMLIAELMRLHRARIRKQLSEREAEFLRRLHQNLPRKDLAS